MKPKSASSLSALAASVLFFAGSPTLATAATLTWDTATGDGATVTAGSGSWNLTAGNTVWNDAGTNVIWSQTLINDASNAAVFAGTDGTANQYVVTLGAQMAAESITFNSSGYRITGSTLALMPTTTTNGAITVAADKTATINSTLRYAHNVAATITSNLGSVLNLGGGTTSTFNPQLTLTGAGTVNVTAGTYSTGIGNYNAAIINQTGGNWTMGGQSTTLSLSTSIGSNAGRNVNYTVSGTGTLNLLANDDATGTYTLSLGRTMVNFKSTLTLQTGGIVNIGVTANRAGQINLGSFDGNGNSLLDVQGGTLTVGTGKTTNKLYFFAAGAFAGKTATMTQSGGTSAINGIQFGANTEDTAGGLNGANTYAANSSATLQLSGGSLYVGAQGITRGTAAAALPVTIQLQGGTLGASANWSSSLDMKLTGATIRAQDAASTARNITLSGILSNDDAVNGTLTKTGSGTLTLSGASDNTFTGATLVNAGTLDLGKVNAVSSSSSLTIASGARLALSTSSSTVPNITCAGTATLSFNVADGHSLTVSGTDGVTNSGAAGSVTINITGGTPANGTYTLIGYSGALQGSGFSAYTLGSTPAGKSCTLNDSGSAVQLVVSSAYSWTGAQSSEWSTATIAGLKNWNLDGSPADYVNGIAVNFDDTATNKTVEITGADVTPLLVAFNSGIYTLQGSNKIAGPAPVTVAATATLKLGSSNVLPDGSGTGNLTVSGILDLNGQSDTINGLSGNGSVDNTAATTTSTLSVGASAGGNFSGTLQNSVGTLALIKTGATDFILSGSNTYSGATTVNQSRLFIASSAAFSPSTAVTVNSGASFVLNATGTPAFSQSISLASGSNLSLRRTATLSNVILPTSGSVRFNFDDGTTQAFSLASNVALSGPLSVQLGLDSGTPGIVTLAGILSGSGSLVKIGSGQLSLGGENTFNGGLTIRNGTVEAKTTNAALGAGTVAIGGAGSSGASLITGRVLSNAITVNAPDSGSAVIGANGNGSGFILSGPVTLNGDLTLQTFDNPVPTPPATTRAQAILTGGVTGTGNLLLNNLGLATNIITLNTTDINHTGTITLQGTATGDTTISANIGSNVTGIIQNSATSIMILNGAKTYACNLTVNAGMVTISDNSNTANDASTVTIESSGATLNLTYAGTDTVDKLVIGNTQQPAGVYGKVGSASPVIGISQIIGDGTLTVGAGTSNFASWANDPLKGNIPGEPATGDFDNDGISNIVEYALGLNPRVSSQPAGVLSGNTITFTKGADAIANGDVSWVIETSVTLAGGSWFEEPVVPGATISYTFTPGTPVKKFARLKVTQIIP